MLARYTSVLRLATPLQILTNRKKLLGVNSSVGLTHHHHQRRKKLTLGAWQPKVQASSTCDRPELCLKLRLD